MAFGRSNSLSLNTSAVNNSFAAQQNQQPAQSAGSLFGGSLFGNSTAAKPATTGESGLFGSQPTQAPASTNLFGSTATTQPAASTSLFGSASAAQPAASTSLFGQQSQAAPSNSLFGQPVNQQPANSNSLFGGSLFGQSTNQPAKPAPSLFGASTATTAPAVNQNAVQPNPMQTSLLGASRYSMGQPAPYTGRLSMGQGTTSQTSITPATKLNWENVRPTTRFDDLVDTAKEQLELVDKMVQQQETFCKQIEAFLPVHGNNVTSLGPDVTLIKDKTETAESALVTDAQGVQTSKDLAEKDHADVLRCERIGENLRLPSQYHYAPAATKYGARKANGTDGVLNGDYDTDLVGNYFTPVALEMQKLLDTYQANLSEIENHLQTIEGSAVAQARSLNQQRGGPPSSSDAHQQLTDTLRDMEGTILTTAAKVGACREGVTNLSLRQAHAASRRA